MSYAGNPNLAPDVQKRIVDTFVHSVESASRGSLEEARLGCEFIQQLDPLFTPAQSLLERLRGAAGPVAADDLRARAQGDGATAAAQGGAGAALIRQELERLVAARDFQQLAVRAQAAHAAIGADPELQRLMAQAQELMEASPYVEKFLQQAQSARAAGRMDEALAALAKARKLDPGHPGIAALQGAPAAASAPQAAPAPPPVTFDAEPEPLSFEPAPELSFESPSFSAVEPMALEPPPLELPELDSSALPDTSFDELHELSLDGPGEGPAFGAEPPASGGASDPDPRVAELLDEGQALYQRGELQGAIDAWSRIFLIDIDHQEAARRIERARTAKAEQERQVEESYHEALGQVQAGDSAGARETLERVLQMQPNHVAARDALAKLERGESLDVPRAAAAGAEAALPRIEAEDAELKEEILVPPDPSAAPGRAAAAAKGGGSRRPLLLAAAAVLVVLAGGGFLVWQNWSKWFPNTQTATTTGKKGEQTPITRANQLYKEGKRAIAIAQLKRVPPASPFYEEAQALIGQWEQEEAAAARPAGPSPEQQAKRDALLAQVKQAQSERHFLAIAPLLDQMAAIAPLSTDEQAIKTQAEEQTQPLKQILGTLKAEEYDQAARQLWIVLDKDSGNADARSLLTTTYYNLGVLSLQQGKPEDAETNLKEAANLTPADSDVQRLLQLAQTYRERTPDLLYRIYTKYLNPRPV